MSITPATRYIRFTTFRRSGEEVATPVWLARLPDGAYGFYTGSGTGKAKRLRHTPRALAQPSSFRGVPVDGTEPVVVECALVTGDELEQIKGAVRRKYGRIMPAIAQARETVLGRLSSRPVTYGDLGVRFRLPE